MYKYNHKKIEEKWQQYWEKNKIFQPDIKNAKKPFYNLMMFPYPSAEGMHVGNMYAFTGSDIYGRFKKLQGYDLFEPIGLDGFGIHSENYAIKKNTHPAKMAKITKKNFYRQLKATGNAYAWNNTLETYDPDYYKWTQWIFIQMFKKGLAVRKKAPVNWCPSCKTVLADEQVESGICERCKTKVIKKDLEQWFFHITKYVEKLHQDLNKIDWSKNVKTAQRNWIGRSEGALVRFATQNDADRKSNAERRGKDIFIEVFTTRADTLFGATYLVVAPENDIITKLKFHISNSAEIKRYINDVRRKSDLERSDLSKEKTGIEIKGIKAINPVNKKEIPIFVADYVLPSYGTGAIMAVPAHDKRDYEFAKKFKLPIVNVIAPYLITDAINGKKIVKRKMVQAIVIDKKKENVLCIKWKRGGWGSFIMGGIDNDKSLENAALREICEETGYIDLNLLQKFSGEVHALYYATHKDENRYAKIKGLVFILNSNKKTRRNKGDKKQFDIKWVKLNSVSKFVSNSPSQLFFWNRYFKKEIFTDAGVLINSGKFDGMSSQKAQNAITKFVNGKQTIRYKLRDWLISRQRYWGPPIPMVKCEKCGWVPTPEKDLPILLPETENWRPKGTGVSPLANIPEFVNTKCPKCGGSAKRETDVSDTFLDSAWYFFRYIDNKNKNKIFNSQIDNKWLPVDMYIGGAEHSVLHLLYVRFITIVFKEMGLINFDDPFKKFRVHGLIIKDGDKMSKSRGNIVVPDEYIKRYGVDTLRMYLMFLGPYTEGGDFNDSNIKGIERFLFKIWRYYQKSIEHIKTLPTHSSQSIHNKLRETINKVSNDIESSGYNTAISKMMIFINYLTKTEKDISKEDLEKFLQILSPFAPHISEELWSQLGHNESIFKSTWPKVTGKVEKAVMNIPVMINGKKRALLEIETAKKLSKNEIINLALLDKNVRQYIKGKKIKRKMCIETKTSKIVSIVV